MRLIQSLDQSVLSVVSCCCRREGLRAGYPRPMSTSPTLHPRHSTLLTT